MARAKGDGRRLPRARSVGKRYKLPDQTWTSLKKKTAPIELSEKCRDGLQTVTMIYVEASREHSPENTILLSALQQELRHWLIATRKFQQTIASRTVGQRSGSPVSRNNVLGEFLEKFIAERGASSPSAQFINYFVEAGLRAGEVVQGELRVAGQKASIADDLWLHWAYQVQDILSNNGMKPKRNKRKLQLQTVVTAVEELQDSLPRWVKRYGGSAVRENLKRARNTAGKLSQQDRLFALAAYGRGLIDGPQVGLKRASDADLSKMSQIIESEIQKIPGAIAESRAKIRKR